MPEKLSNLDSEFRTHHHTLINLIDDEEELAKEQEMLDAHDDLIAELHVRVRRVITAPPSKASLYRVMSQMLAHLKKSLASIASTVNEKSSAPLDVCLIRQCEEKTDDINKELSKA